MALSEEEAWGHVLARLPDPMMPRRKLVASRLPPTTSFSHITHMYVRVTRRLFP